MSSSSSSIRMAVFDTPTIPTIAMTVSFEKKVRATCVPPLPPLSRLTNPSLLVWIGPLVVKELKRVIESSEITKFVISLS